MKKIFRISLTMILLLMMGLAEYSFVTAQRLPEAFGWEYKYSKPLQNARTETLPGISVAVTGKLGLCNTFDRGHIILNVQGGTPPYSFLWNNLETVKDRFNLFAGTYTVVVSDSKGLNHTERIVIQPPFPLILEMVEKQDASCGNGKDGAAKIRVKFGRGAPYKVEWSHGLKDNMEAKDLAPGFYTVKVTDPLSCDASISFEIKSQTPAIEVKEKIEQISCASSNSGAISLEVNGGKAPYTYLWSNGATSKDVSGLTAGTYHVQIKDASGCSYSNSYTIEAPKNLEVRLVAVKDNACFNAEEGEIDIEVTGGAGNYRYQWSNGATTPSIKNLKAGTYQVKVTDAAGCEVSRSYEVKGAAAFAVKIQTSLDVNCETGQAKGLAWVNIEGGVAPYKVIWSNGNTEVREVEFTQAGELSVEVLDANGCKVGDKVRVDFPSTIFSGKVDFQVRKLEVTADDQVMVYEPLVFQGQISEDFIAWEWNFGDGEQSTEREPVHTYKKPGSFEVTLKAYDVFGCSSMESHTVEVTQLQEWITIPNAFSPNGDGLNDVFAPVLKGVQAFEMDIFNQWGERMFHSSDLDIKGWDGTYKGVLLPRGNYVYKISLTTISGERIQKTGSITLMR